MFVLDSVFLIWRYLSWHLFTLEFELLLFLVLAWVDSVFLIMHRRLQVRSFIAPKMMIILFESNFRCFGISTETRSDLSMFRNHFRCSLFQNLDTILINPGWLLDSFELFLHFIVLDCFTRSQRPLGIASCGRFKGCFALSSQPGLGVEVSCIRSLSWFFEV